jgi:hypothetical protein
MHGTRFYGHLYNCDSNDEVVGSDRTIVSIDRDDLGPPGDVGELQLLRLRHHLTRFRDITVSARAPSLRCQTGLTMAF